MSSSSTSLTGASSERETPGDGAIPSKTTSRRRGGLRRDFTPTADHIIRLAHSGFLKVHEARRLISCGNAAFYRRMAELGLPLHGGAKGLRSPIPAEAGDPSRPAAGRTTAPRDSGAGLSSLPNTGHLNPAALPQDGAAGSFPTEIAIPRQRAGVASATAQQGIAPGRVNPASSRKSQTAGVAGAPCASSERIHRGGAGNFRVFTAEEDALIRRVAAGEVPRDRACRELRTTYTKLLARLRDLGCEVKQYVRHKPTPLADCPPGWIPIAHGGAGIWREYEGSPVSIEEARALSERGLGTMAQKRIDGGFDLLFRARHPTVSREDTWQRT